MFNTKKEALTKVSFLVQLKQSAGQITSYSGLTQ